MELPRKICKDNRKSGYRCILHHCAKSKRINPGIRMFRFPPCYTIFGKLWRNTCGIQNEKRLNIYICEEHFTPDCFGNKFLKRDAVPSLFLNSWTGVLNKDSNSAGSNAAEIAMETASIEIKPSPPSSPIPISSSEERSQYSNDDELRCVSSTPYFIEMDDYDIFGRFVASELRGLASDISLVRSVKRNIQLTILEAYENKMNK